MPDTHSIPAGDFKARCLKLMDEVAETRQPLIITKHGKPVARLVPVEAEPSLFGALKGNVVHEADIVSPTGADWDADR